MVDQFRLAHTIKPMDDRSAVEVACERLIKMLPPNIRSSIAVHWESGSGDKPDLVERPSYDIKHYRGRFLPRRGRLRTPGQFWTPQRCFYEIGAGVYGRGPDRSQVQFFMAGNQAVRGGGRYNRQVDDILRKAAEKRADAVHRSILRGCPYAHLWIRSPLVNPGKMAEDMAWIIQETLPELLRIPDAIK